MHKNRSTRIRLVAVAIAGLLWLPVLALGFETYERTRTAVGNALFPAMLDRRMSHQFGMAFVDPEQRLTPPAASAERALDGAPLLPRAEAEPPDLSGLDRGVAAAVERYTFMRVSDAGEVLEAYGEPAIETHIRHLLDVARVDPEREGAAGRFMGPRSAIEFEYDFFFATIFRYYRVVVTPGDGERTIEAFERTHEMPYEKLEFGNPDPGGLWLAPFFAQRPNYASDDPMERSNNFGFWDRDIEVPKPPGVFRIVCLGGSTTHEGPSMDRTYPKRVERLLRERFGDHIEVINAGLIGNTSFNIHTRIAHYLSMEPDLLLYYGGVNDICHHYFQLWLELREEENRHLRRSYALRRLYNRSVLPSDDELRAFLRRTTLRNLAAVRVHAQMAGADLIVASFAFPDPRKLGPLDRLFLDTNMTASWGGGGMVNYQTYTDVIRLLNDELTRWGEEPGGPVVLPVADYFTGGSELFADTCHVTEAGMVKKSAVFAQLLGEHLATSPEFATMP